MADDQTSTPVAAQPEPDEGVLHSLATALGIDPEAVVQTAKAIRANPVQTLKDVGSQQVQELEDAAASPIQTVKTVAKGVGDLLTNPEAQSTAISRLKAPGVVNKLQGAGEYASSLVPLIGSGLVKSEEQAGKGNLAGSAGTLIGTVGPLLTDTEGGEALKEHLSETAKTGIESAKEEISKAANAKAPKGSTEAGTVKLGEAPKGEDAIKVFTDSLGIKWAENPDGVRVSIPKRIPDEEVPNYASQKLSEQVAGRADLKKQVSFDSLGGKQVKPPDVAASSIQPDIKAEGPEWDRVHNAFVDGKKVGSVGYKLDPEGRAQIYGSQVSPDLRGQGIGQKLYRQAIDDARTAGAERITSDSTNTSPEANRVWEKLREKGLPVEDITHPNGKPGYQIDFENPVQPAPQVAPDPQFVPTLAARGQLPNQKVNLGEAYGDTGKYVGGLKNNPPLPGEDPLTHYNKVVGSTTGPELLDIPKELMTEGGTTHDAITHELGHAVAMDLTGLPTASSEIRSHLHPDIFDRGAAANISTDWSSLPGVTRSVLTGNLHFPKESLQQYWPNFLQTYLGGGVAQELVHGIPIAENEGMHGDLQVLHSIGKSMGFTPEETQDMIAAGVHKTRALLNHPETLDIIKREAGQREEGLPRTLHASAAKVQDVIRQVREARNAANTTAGGEANGGVNEKTQPSGAGQNTEGNVREGDGQAIPTGADARKADSEDQVDSVVQHFDSVYPRAQKTVDGRTVRSEIPNLSSIGASLSYYETLPGVREISLHDWTAPPEINARTKKLAADIKESGELNPLIVAIDKDGPYILEGGHRYDALKMSGAKSFPAVVVIDTDPSSIPEIPTQLDSRKVKDGEEPYHPDLQKMADKRGLSDDASQVRKGSSFITPDGKFIHLGLGIQHPDAIENDTDFMSHYKPPKGQTAVDIRVPFINETGAVRTRFSSGKSGDQLSISIPEKGITPEQVDAIKQAVGQGLKRNGTLVIETSNTKGHSVTKEFATSKDVEPAIEKITSEISPPKEITPLALKRVDKSELSEPGYVYHATNEDRASDIAHDGLKTHKPHEFTDQATWPDGSAEKRNYFTKTAEHTWQFAPEDGKPVLIRTKPTLDFKTESTGDVYTKKTISPENIEVLGNDNQWHPISKFKNSSDIAVPRVMKQSGSEDMSDPELAFNAARHEAGHAVISEALNPGTVSSMALDENGGKTIVNAPNGKQTVGALSPDELRDMVATSLAGGMTEPGGTTVEHASGDVKNRGTLLGPAADTWQQQLGRLVMPAQGVPNDPMLQNNQTLAESKARVTALLADPKVRKNIDTVAAHLAAKKNLSGDEVRAIIQKK